MRNDGDNGRNSLSIIIDVLRVLVGRISSDCEDESGALRAEFYKGNSLTSVFPISNAVPSSPILSSKLSNKIMWSPQN